MHLCACPVESGDVEHTIRASTRPPILNAAAVQNKPVPALALLPGCLHSAVGNVPLWWYKDEDHVGYDKDGKKIIKKGRGDRLDALLQRNDSRKVCARPPQSCLLQPALLSTPAGLWLGSKK